SHHPCSNKLVRDKLWPVWARAYLPQGKQGICLGRHFLERQCHPWKKGWKKGHTQHGDQMGSERGCRLLDGVFRA
ncbi:unnamed protein product, partial [Staurois parvus]